MPDMTPTAEKIARRLRVKLDGRPGNTARVVSYEHAIAGAPRRVPRHGVGISGRRTMVVGQALRWRALGFDVEVRLSPLGNFKAFPATQEEAEQAVREIVARKGLGILKYKMILDRLDRARGEES